jgi:hypothetical protein
MLDLRVSAAHSDDCAEYDLLGCNAAGFAGFFFGILWDPLKMEPICSSETSRYILTTRRYNPEDRARQGFWLGCCIKSLRIHLRFRAELELIGVGYEEIASGM